MEIGYQLTDEKETEYSDVYKLDLNPPSGFNIGLRLFGF
jgi:hypothetical protein